MDDQNEPLQTDTSDDLEPSYPDDSPSDGVFMPPEDEDQGSISALSLDERFPDSTDLNAPHLDSLSDLDLASSEFLDIEAALASVASLSDVIAEREAVEAAEIARQEAEEQAREEAVARRAAYYFPRPPLTTLQRGQLASVVPALLLIASGAALTFLLATDALTVSPAILMLVAASVPGLILVSFGLSGGRWARGALFSGTALLLTTGLIYFFSQNDTIGFRGWPLIISAWGLAILLAGLLTPAKVINQRFLGMLLIVAGMVGYLVTGQYLTTDLTHLIQTYGPYAAGAAAVILLVPGVLKRRR